jgi:oligogalacturonide lyase
LYAVTADAATLKGKVYPDEHKVLKAEESGFEVLQLTTDPADDSGLYFTSQSFVPDDNGLVFTSKRTGAWNLFYMNLKDFTFVQLTDSKKISGTGADVCAATHEVFYRDGQAVKAVNLKTLAEHTLTTVPDGYSVGSAMSVTVSGEALAFSISENIKLTTKTDKIYSDMDEHFAKRPWSAVWTGRADGSGWHEIARQKKWISHTLISPRNPNLILYCHEVLLPAALAPASGFFARRCLRALHQLPGRQRRRVPHQAPLTTDAVVIPIHILEDIGLKCVE